MSVEILGRSAVISACGRYRYSLRRHWATRGAGRVVFVMLNPSTADADRDDPTIRKCVGYANLWGYSTLEVVNLYAWRATDPKALVAALRAGENVIGQENEARIIDAVQGARGDERAALVVAAWGRPSCHEIAMRAWAVHDLIACPAIEAEVHCLDTTKEGWPRHPLYPKGDLYPKRWSMRVVR